MPSYSWGESRPLSVINQNWHCFYMSDDGLIGLACVWGGRIYKTIDGGKNWAETQPAGDGNRNWYCCDGDSDGSVLVVASSNYLSTEPEDGKVYLSTNSGSTWAEIQPAGATTKDWRAVSMDDDGSVIMMGEDRIWLSTNTGSTWAENRPDGDSSWDWRSIAVGTDGTKISVAHGQWSGSNKLLISSNTGSSWTEKVPKAEKDVFWEHLSMSGDGTKILISGFYNDQTKGYMYLSSDSGENWSEIKPVVTNLYRFRYCSVSSDGQKILAVDFGLGGSSSGGRAWLSEDGGSTWVDQLSSYGDRIYRSCYMIPNGTKMLTAFRSAYAFPPVNGYMFLYGTVTTSERISCYERHTHVGGQSCWKS